MAPIVDLNVYVDWDDDGFTTGALDNISADVHHPSAVLVSVEHGANFDGQGIAAGSAVILVENSTNKYTPQNAAGTLYGKLKPGRQVWVTATYSGTTYGVFHGFLRRIVPRTDKWAELHCEDMLFRLGRKEINLPMSDARTLQMFRDDVLDDTGLVPNGQRVYLNGGEYGTPITGCDQKSALDVLNEISQATAALHFMRYGNTAALPFFYVVKDRGYLQTQASIASYGGSGQPAIFSGTNFDTADELLINAQRVTPQPLAKSPDNWQLWEHPDTITVKGGTTRTIWAEWNDPLVREKPAMMTYTAAITYTAIKGAPTVTVIYFSNSAKIVINAAGTSPTNDAILKELRISGVVAVASDVVSVLEEDSASIVANDRWLGSEITSQWLVNEWEAQGLAKYLLFRYATPRARPTLVLEQQYPAIFVREPGDRITASVARFGIVNTLLEIRSTRLEMRSGGQWTATWECEEAPAAVDAFTLGGTAAQGLGGTGILAY